ncbi:STAS domain-containing protein [Streptomyces katrae]|uniref:STAS domain-containing protein n=1 Tax=Streptomyces katrae TaxID=68223 RepID=UPI001331AA2D|nr:STAS domain-containing protein [Streptomyces katrae]
MTAEFDVRADRGADGGLRTPVVVHVSGEIDIRHAGELESRLTAALSQAEPAAAVIVDLSNSSFCDSSGLTALLRAREAALRAGHTLSLAAPSHQMLRLLDLTGTAELFPLEPAG